MAFEAPRELYRLAEEKLGPRIAWLGLAAFWITLVSTGLLIGGTLVYQVNGKIVAPILDYLPSLQGVGQDALVSFGLTVLLLAVSGILVFRRFQRWERVLLGAIEDYVRAHTQHIATESQNNIAELDRRVTSLETHTDITGSRRRLTETLARRTPSEKGATEQALKALRDVTKTDH